MALDPQMEDGFANKATSPVYVRNVAGSLLFGIFSLLFSMEVLYVLCILYSYYYYRDEWFRNLYDGLVQAITVIVTASTVAVTALMIIFNLVCAIFRPMSQLSRTRMIVVSLVMALASLFCLIMELLLGLVCVYIRIGTRDQALLLSSILPAVLMQVLAFKEHSSGARLLWPFASC